MTQDSNGSPALTDAQMMDRIEAVDTQLNRLNAVIREAVDAGLSVELHRSEHYPCPTAVRAFLSDLSLR